MLQNDAHLSLVCHLARRTVRASVAYGQSSHNFNVFSSLYTVIGSIVSVHVWGYCSIKFMLTGVISENRNLAGLSTAQFHAETYGAYDYIQSSLTQI